MDERNQPAGEACDVCGEVVTKLYPGRPGQPARIDFTTHNREAYERHLGLTAGSAYDLEGFHFVPTTIAGPLSTLGRVGDRLVPTGGDVLDLPRRGFASYPIVVR